MAGKKILTQFALPVGSTSGSFGNGTAGQVLTSGGASASMYWGTAGGSSGIGKATFHLKWGSESGNGTNGSWRDSGTDGKIELMHGSTAANTYWADGDNDALVKIRFTHDLNTKYITASILDVAGRITASANEYIDLGHNQHGLVKYINANISEVCIDLSYNDTIATNDEFELTFIG
tara:strand:+ start:980 stop:1510 length:531 start_codon:yes stop_codon:yes gene_type:complete